MLKTPEVDTNIIRESERFGLLSKKRDEKNSIWEGRLK